MDALSECQAIVAYGPANASQWKLETVIPRALHAREVLVNIVACGICPADLHSGNISPSTETNEGYYPRIFGHEGSGYIEEVGSSVTAVKRFDPVLLSFASCGACHNCIDSHPAYCTQLIRLNFTGECAVYAQLPHVFPHSSVGASFFGQSSFASKAIVKESCLVNLAGLDITRRELELLAPLGCAVQTGTGALINVADVKSHHDVAVVGVGGVGQSAIMAAALRGCRVIIAIDRDDRRLRIARSLGATHIIDTSVESVNLVKEVLNITKGRGVHVSLDTTGVQALAKQSWEFVRSFGKVLQVGLARPDDLWNICMADHMNSGKQIIGCVEGDAVPQAYVLQMVQWFRQGRLPLEKIVQTYPAEQFQTAILDMQNGVTIKPVLVWS